MNPIFFKLYLYFESQSPKLSKQHQHVLPRVSLALLTAILMEFMVASESSHSVLRQVGYLIMKAASTMKMMKYRSMVTEQAMTNLFLFLIRPQIPDRLDRIIMIEVTMNVAMKPFRKSGRICAVTDEIKKAYTSTYRSTIPNSRVTTIPADISVFRQYTDRNIIYNYPIYHFHISTFLSVIIIVFTQHLKVLITGQYKIC